MSSYSPTPLRTAKALLVYRGESMRSAARAIGYDYAHVRKVLGGQIPMTRRFMRAMSVWTGVPDETLFPEVLADSTSQGGDAA